MNCLNKISFLVATLLTFNTAHSNVFILSEGTFYPPFESTVLPLGESEVLGLSMKDSNIKKVKLIVSECTDCHSHNDDEKNNTPIEEREKAISFEPAVDYIIRGLPSLKEGPIKTYTYQGSLRKLGEIVTFPEFSDFTLFTTGSIDEKEVEEFQPNLVINSYTVHVRYKGKVTTLTAPIEASQTHEIMWAGDLNGDGFPDFIIDYNPLEKSGTEQFYLSEPKPDGTLKYKLIGERQFMGC